ncbi:serpin B3-like [Drosophila hydei]|uniref:Serpin B3-like n=1 Tax=Drosophila hydei TaxID=7224 RepID=A0A6J1LIF2_DROHY|nr:serpin B3-like [Drosophila hydei]
MKLIKAIFQENDGSVMFSPIMLINAMKMFAAWTAGNTAAQINQVMLFNKNKLLADYEDIDNDDYIYDSHDDDQNYRDMGDVMTVNTALFVSTNVIAADNIANQIDFTNATRAMKIINGWVEFQTKSRIKNLVTEFHKFTKIASITAAYYEAEWKYKFLPSNTKKVPFYTSLTKTIQVDMMSLTTKLSYKYIRAIDATVLELPLKEKDVKLLVMLPKKIDGINMMIEKLPMIEMHNIKLRRATREVHLELPKFIVDFEVDLKRTLINLGIKDLFTDANFSKLTDKTGILKVDVMIQKIVVEINENGAIMATGARAMPPKKVFNFKVDHPFIYLFRQYNRIFYAGRVDFQDKETE